MMPDKLQQNSALFSDQLWREIPANNGLARYPRVPRRRQESDIAHHSQPGQTLAQARPRHLAKAIDVAWAIDRRGAAMDVFLKGTAVWSRSAVPTKQNDCNHRPPACG
jgi:hypothetical protein